MTGPVTGQGSGTTHYYLTDHLGTVRAILDENGTVLSTHDYEPFGTELEPFSSDLTDNKYKYTGQERDARTGMDYMHFRYYASTMGRFMKPDNMITNAANPQSWNLYSYVNGNPVNFNDPSGHYADVPGWTKAVLYGGPGVAMPMAYNYGGGWFSEEIHNFFGSGPINITLNAVIDQNMSPEDQAKARDQFEDQLDKANSVYNKIGIFIGADYQVGNIPQKGENETLDQFHRKCFSMSPPGKITVFISNWYKGASAGVNTETRTGYVLLGVLNKRSSIWHLTHELGHIFGFTLGPEGGPEGVVPNVLNDYAINMFRRYMCGLTPFLEPVPVSILTASWWLRHNASIWGE